MTTERKTYHRDVWLPDAARGIQFATLLRHSRHAVQESKSDKLGEFTLPAVLDTRNATLIEATYEGARFVKGVFRQQYDRLRDLVLVVDIQASFVITAWLQSADDHHSTLNREVYATE